MVTNYKLAQTPAVALYSGMSATATSMVITPYPVDLDGNKLTMNDFGTVGRVTIDPKVTGFEEIVEFSSMTDNGNNTCTLGSLGRNTISKYPYNTYGTGKIHGASAVVVFSDNPQAYGEFPAKRNDETIAGLWTFLQTPLGLNAGAVNDASTINMGITRSSVAPNRTIGTFTVTIASPAVFTLNAHGLILNDRVQFTTSGTLPTGLSLATTYYVISTGLTTNNFQVSLSQGGTAVNTTVVGSGTHTLTRFTPIYVADTDTRLAPNNGAIATGSANAFVVTLTPAITAYSQFQVYSFKANFAITGSATVNYNGIGALTFKKLDGATNLISGDIANGMTVQWIYDGTNAILLNPPANAGLTSSSLKFGGTGADGALTLTSGATNINCANAAVVVKNYTSISITGTGSLTFTNPHVNGTIVILKSQGAVTLTSSTAPMIAMQGMGASGGGGAGAAGGAGVGGVGSAGQSTCYVPTTCGGGGGANNSSSIASTAGTTPFFSSNLNLVGKYTQPFQVGSGGGGGGDGGLGGNSGGRGGGGLIIECAGAFNFTTANGISVAGSNGTNAIVSGGSGGGGGGGFVYILYGSLVANSGTITVSGGVGASSGGASCNGGAGGASQFTNGSDGTGKNTKGGDSVAGWSLVTANTDFC